MGGHSETNPTAKQATSLPEDVEQAVRRYVAIQRETAALQEERYRLRDLIAHYMATAGAASMTPEVDGIRMVVRNATKSVVKYDEAVLKARLGPNYRLILWPDPDKIKKNLPKAAPLLMPILDEIGSPSPEVVKAMIASGKLRKEQFDDAFERRQIQTFSISRERTPGLRMDGSADRAED